MDREHSGRSITHLKAFENITHVTNGRLEGFYTRRFPDVKKVLDLKKEPADSMPERTSLITTLQAGIVTDYLTERTKIFGEEQTKPLGSQEEFSDVDTYVVVKLYNEKERIGKAVDSLLNQKNFDLKRLAIVVVNSNSTDKSAEIVDDIIQTNETGAKILRVNQSTYGAGNAARVGSDRALATLAQMSDEKPDLLNNGIICVVDGDSDFNENYLSSVTNAFLQRQTSESIVPLFSFSQNSQLSLFENYEKGETHDEFLGKKGLKEDEQWKYLTTIGYDIFMQQAFEKFVPDGVISAPDTRHNSGVAFRPWTIAACGGIIQPERKGKLMFGPDYDMGKRIKEMGIPVSLLHKVLGNTEVDRVFKWISSTYDKNAQHYNDMTVATPHGDIQRRTEGDYRHLKNDFETLQERLKSYPDEFWKEMFPERMRTLFRFLIRNAIISYTKTREDSQSEVKEFLPKLLSRSPESLDQILQEKGILGTKLNESYADKVADDMVVFPEGFNACMTFYKTVLDSYYEEHQLPQAKDIFPPLESITLPTK